MNKVLSDKELKFLISDTDGRLLCAVIEQFVVGDTLLLKTSNPYTSHFHLESHLIQGLWTLQCDSSSGINNWDRNKVRIEIKDD